VYKGVAEINVIIFFSSKPFISIIGNSLFLFFIWLDFDEWLSILYLLISEGVLHFLESQFQSVQEIIMLLTITINIPKKKQ